jgi:hypothetical protein
VRKPFHYAQHLITLPRLLVPLSTLDKRKKTRGKRQEEKDKIEKDKTKP